jgi:hypothetical protein
LPGNQIIQREYLAKIFPGGSSTTPGLADARIGRMREAGRSVDMDLEEMNSFPKESGSRIDSGVSCASSEAQAQASGHRAVLSFAGIRLAVAAVCGFFNNIRLRRTAAERNRHERRKEDG